MTEDYVPILTTVSRKKAMKHKKILVADDDEQIRFAFRKVLQDEGYTVIEAKNGKEAIEKFESEQPAIVFLDIAMPQMSGIEILKQIKLKKSMSKVIIITAYSSIQNKKQAMVLGAFEYLQKPLSVFTIREVINRATLD